MSATKKVLTSLHGRLCGIDATGKLIAKSGFTVRMSNDGGAIFAVQSTPGTLNATGTLTAALLKSGIVTSTTAAAVAATLDTGTAMDAAFTQNEALAVDDCIEWTAINTGGANAFTVTASAGHTIVGSGTVAASTSARFRTRKTAANTYVTYRI